MSNQVLFPIVAKDTELLPFFVTGIGLEYEECGAIRENGYQDYQWAYCLSGEGRFEAEGRSYTIREGMAFFFRKDIPHRYRGLTKPWQIEWVTFNGSGVEGLLAYMGSGLVEVYDLRRIAEAKSRLRDMVYTWQGQDNLHERTMRSSQKLYEFLIFMKEHKNSSRQDARECGYERLRPIIQYMDKHYARPMTLEELAQEIGVTKYYLCRLFKDTYHTKPFEYLNQVRIQKAKEYLVSREEVKVKEIGLSVGFNDTSYFCLKFKESEGCSPLAFRQRYFY
ncbi:MAG: AraC family transcriptional regulator [Cellulosilyticaceae bacterium]